MASKGGSSLYLPIFGLFAWLLGSLLVFYLLECLLSLEWPVIKLFAYFGYVDAFGKASVLGTDVLIDYQCSGFFSIFVYLALIFSPITRLSIKKRVYVFIFGAVILYIANILRLFALFEFANSLSVNSLHILGWIFMSAIIFVLWSFATRTIKNKQI